MTANNRTLCHKLIEQAKVFSVTSKQRARLARVLLPLVLLLQEGEEQKLIYTDLFQQYTTLVEGAIDSRLRAMVPGFDMQARRTMRYNVTMWEAGGQRGG
jgi:hypothetical protein